MTPHIEAKKADIAKTVIMPGDPKRAKLIATKYLKDSRLVSEVRGILAYTGFYKDKQVTIMASGMGMPSMGIYSYELFKFYDVDTIIRIGTCGALQENVCLNDIIIPDNALTFLFLCSERLTFLSKNSIRSFRSFVPMPERTPK